jgi:uncharacterized protein (TIGR03083 family)
MDSARFLECMKADYLRMREVVQGHYPAPVPTCPDWTVADLVRHVAQVYLHKTELMRNGKEPGQWPPAEFAGTDPVQLLDRGYNAVTAEFAARKASDTTTTWYEPDQTVGFWIRRMAQETVIHRIDAELACGALVAPIPEDLSVDGVDELLTIFLGWSFTQWPEDFTAALKDSPGHGYLVRTDGASESRTVSWLIRTATGQLTVAGGPDEDTADEDRADEEPTADATLSGTPAAVLRWGWNREAETAPGQVSAVVVSGDPEALAELRRCLVAATQ